MSEQLLFCPTCRDLVPHLVETVPEGDVAWCQACRRIHLVAEPNLPLPPATPPACWE